MLQAYLYPNLYLCTNSHTTKLEEGLKKGGVLSKAAWEKTEGVASTFEWCALYTKHFLSHKDEKTSISNPSFYITETPSSSYSKDFSFTR